MDPILISLFIASISGLLSFWAWAVEWLLRGSS
jgi:hypothetical protein